MAMEKIKPPPGLEHYPGNKWSNGVFQKIINEIPTHEKYVEPFLGSGAILLNKLPSAVTVGNDINTGVIEKWWELGILNTTFTVMPAMELLKRYFSGRTDTFVYMDPPYPIGCRRSKKRMYDQELTDKNHCELLQLVLKVKFNCMISTYPNPIYEKYLAKWRKVEFKAATHAGTATEVLYMNYDTPKELHDYRYLGTDCWDRQRIKRKIAARINTLKKLPILEQRAIMKGLNEAAVQ